MTTFGLEFVTVVPYLAAIGLLTTSEVAVAQWVPALLAYNIIMVTPSLMLLGATLLARGRMRDRYIHWGERLDAATRPAAAWVVGGVGGILILQTVGTSLRAG